MATRGGVSVGRTGFHNLDPTTPDRSATPPDNGEMPGRTLQEYMHDIALERVCLESLQRRLASIRNADDPAVGELETDIEESRQAIATLERRIRSLGGNPDGPGGVIAGGLDLVLV